MFGLIIPTRPVLGPHHLQTISLTQYAYTFPSTPHFSHIIVFLLPDNTLPPDVGAAIYIRFPTSPTTPNPEFRLLGAISMEKQSAIFKINAGAGGGSDTTGAVIGSVNGVAEIDMDATSPDTGGGDITIGISIEPASSLAPQLEALAQQKTLAANSAGSGTMTLYNGGRNIGQPSTKVLAQRIIKNAFNFLASFEGGDGMVPLRTFEGWWRKFESRVNSDPGFLEKEQE